jgi:hypothetical protein
MMQNRSGILVMTGLTLGATGLYFFLKKVGTGVFEPVVDGNLGMLEAGASDDGTGEKEKVETLKGEGK